VDGEDDNNNVSFTMGEPISACYIRNFVFMEKIGGVNGEPNSLGRQINEVGTPNGFPFRGRRTTWRPK
jgi:hypothetical protein